MLFKTRDSSGRLLRALPALLLIFLTADAAAAAPPYIFDVEGPTAWDQTFLILLKVFTAAWFFTLGGMVGSFLNVVVYRLPRGEGLLWPPSHCPKCAANIRPLDNIPIFGWLKLHGRCRACEAPISPRYPIVEALTATVFFVLATVELFTGGANLPVRPVEPYSGVLWNVWFMRGGVLGIYFFHCTLLAAAIAIVLIDMDGSPQPALRLVLPVFLFAVSAAGLFPQLLPVPLRLAVDGDRWQLSVGQCLAGAAAGGVLGFSLFPKGRRGAAFLLLLTGVFLGWQAAAGVALSGGLFQLLAGAVEPARREWPTSFWLAIGAFFYLLSWKWSAMAWMLPGPYTPAWAWGAWGAAAFVVVFAARIISRSNEPTAPTV